MAAPINSKSSGLNEQIDKTKLTERQQVKNKAWAMKPMIKSKEVLLFCQSDEVSAVARNRRKQIGSIANFYA